MKRQSRPPSGCKVIGAKPLWELWAEGLREADARADELRKLGAFTARDLAAKNGWTHSKAKCICERQGLKYELAADQEVR